MKFQAGDKVRRLFDGQRGVVELVDGSDSILPYWVEFDESFDWMSESGLVADDPTPTVYKLQVPPEPVGVERVRPVGAEDWYFVRESDGWRLSDRPDGIARTWETLVRSYPEGLEPVPDSRSDYDVSLDYLREYPHVLDGLAAYGVTGMHAAAVVRGVLASEEGSE